MVAPYCPDKGDLIWLDFEPQTGREIRERRPALVLSPKAYNRLSGLCILCPISSQVKGHLLEVPVTVEGKAGVIKADQVKSLDWRVRKAKKIRKAPEKTLQVTQQSLQTLLFTE